MLLLAAMESVRSATVHIFDQLNHLEADEVRAGAGMGR
jgi:hypothetical protein